MSPRLRVYLVVAAAALVAAGGAVGVTLATRTPPVSVQKPTGVPPLALDLGVRSDPEAVALARAEQLYAAGKRTQAKAIFARYDSLEAKVGAALAGWPDGTLPELQALARDHPKSSLVQLHLGLADYWDGRDVEAAQAWKAAARAQPDTFYAVRADGLLHPNFLPGLPLFTPSFAIPTRIAKLPAAQQLAALARAAAAGGVRARLLYGAALQQLSRPVSAERQFQLAAEEAPNDPEALTAAAVGRFDKAHPARAFSRLGPLSKRFPKSATVRYHLGLLLLWMEQVGPAKKQLRLAVADDPASAAGREAKRFLDRLGNVGTK